jgi:eukaryotic-like serine/threonine-protein kinase
MSNSEQFKSVLAEQGANLQDTAPYTEQLPDLQLLQTIDDRYFLQSPHVTTHGAAIYKGIDLTTDQDVAIKFYAEPTPRRRAQVTREIGIHLLATMQGTEGFVPAISSGTVEENDMVYRYMAMQFCPEGTLPLQKVQSEDGMRKLLHRTVDVAHALETMHEHNLVHRDVKPDNILVDGVHGRLSDFGISTEPTRANHVYGTSGYIPLESLTDGIVSSKSDVFSFGVTLQAATTGSMPWEVPKVSDGLRPLEVSEMLVRAMQYEKPTSPRAINESISVELEDLMIRCISRAVSDRPTMREVAYDLEVLAA